jgi:hypothetical protein
MSHKKSGSKSDLSIDLKAASIDGKSQAELAEDAGKQGGAHPTSPVFATMRSNTHHVIEDEELDSEFLYSGPETKKLCKLKHERVCVQWTGNEEIV